MKALLVLFSLLLTTVSLHAFQFYYFPSDFTKKARQGYDFQLWISNQGDLAYPFTTDYLPNHIGLLYPVGTLNEHISGAYPFIGGQRFYPGGPTSVTTGEYGRCVGGGDSFGSELLPELDNPWSNRIWQTSIRPQAADVYDSIPPGFYKTEPNLRDVDDDGDGKPDEDDLDGFDNDGDWNDSVDDIGADGTPDSNEVGCKGSYDPVLNPDPAFDNYDPDTNSVDLCRLHGDGTRPNKSNKYFYTEKNGISDHGEPHVDEDYGAVSDNDLSYTATDTFKYPIVSKHTPLGIKLNQKSFSWRNKFADAILPIDYEYINVGKRALYNVYMGMQVSPEVGPIASPLRGDHNYAGYLPEVRTAYAHNPVDKGSTPFGVTILNYTQPSGPESFRFYWTEWNEVPFYTLIGTCDSLFYSLITGRTPLLGEGNIRKSGSPADVGNIAFWFSVGPYTVAPGDTIRLSYAFVSGYGIDRGVNSIRENAMRSHILYTRNYHFPVSPPSPNLALEEGFRRITLRWGGNLDDTNPLEIWDDLNKYVETFPDTHWRRRNPPSGHKWGGRIFKGYRVYRSEDPSGHPSTFTLLRQYEVQDSSSELVTPLDSVFVDSNLVREKVYWYAVTSFGINDYAVIKYQDFDGTVRTDTHTVGFNESDLLENRVRVELPFTVSQKIGDVLVVPNPYRVDRDYTLEEGGWEGRSTHWTENQRRIKFIHLPQKCTIRIYSLSGDIIATLHHDDPVRGDEEWTLLSDSNRAIASGVYIFTVESDLGTQIGKFVVIR